MKNNNIDRQFDELEARLNEWRERLEAINREIREIKER